MVYKSLLLEDVERIREIDAECYIENAWRLVDGVRTLSPIHWTDHELPNGLAWHMEHFKSSLLTGGKAFGCFEDDRLVGYGVIDREILGVRQKYLLLDQLFISKNYRGKGIGKKLFALCCDQAKAFGADKLYICAGSSEDTIAFYFKLGCVEAVEINQRLYELDKNDYQLEYTL